MKRTQKVGAVRKNCPARMGRVYTRRPHWREILVIDEVDVIGNPTKSHHVPEPMIIERPVRALGRGYGRLYSIRSRNKPKHQLDAIARARAPIPTNRFTQPRRR